jgi:hypothetical protein
MPTHLVPVSAVGDNFARYDPGKDAMVKLPQKTPEPYNLDITLALAVTDTLLHSFKRLPSGRDLAWIAFLKSLVGSATALRWVAGAYLGTITDDGLVAAMMIALSKASNSMAKLVVNIEDQKTTKISQIKDRNTALDGITQAQRFIVKKFLDDFPPANLLEIREGEA